MAAPGVSRLSYSGTDVDFRMGIGYERPDLTEAVRPRTLSGKQKHYGFYSVGMWRVPIVKISKTDADWLNDCCIQGYEMTWTPDVTNSSGTTYTVRICNDIQPVWHRIPGQWEANYSGNLALEETS